MTNFKIKINQVAQEGTEKSEKTEIWAEITNKATGTIMNKRIWWVAENGVFRDGVSELPSEVRAMVDNAWIEFRRKL